MSDFLLDTRPLAAYLQGRPAVVSLVSPWLRRHEVTSSILVYGEVMEYFRVLADSAQRQTKLRRFMRKISPSSLSYSILNRYAEVRLQLRRPRRPYGPGLIGDIDTLIAATAIERKLTVVTADTDFLRVPDLSVLLLDRTSLTAVNRP